MLDLGAMPEPARARVAAFVAEARAAHPSLAVDEGAFVAHVLTHVPEGAALADHLGTMRAGDLLVAHRCACGDDAAIAAFERRCFDEIPFAHAKMRPRLAVDEIAQMMRDHLFVRSDDRAPKIEQYAGVGDLRGWFRVVLVRQLLNVVAKVTRETELDDAMLSLLPASVNDPEVEHARRLYTPALKEALAEAIAGLEPRDRTVLRLAVCDGLTVDAIGGVYGVHRATAARWVAGAREHLQEATLERLRVKLGARDESIVSLLRLLASHVDMSLGGHLAS